MEKPSRETEVRKMNPDQAKKLGKYLEPFDACETFMKKIPRAQQDKNEFADMQIFKYNSSHVDQLKEEILNNRPNHNMMQVLLLYEWGTSGQVRPTLGHLMKLLLDLQLYRAADYLAEEILKEPAPARPLQGPAARVDLSLPTASASTTFAATSTGTPSQLPNGSNDRTNYRNMNRTVSKAGPSEMQKVNFQRTDSDEAQSLEATVGDDNIPAVSMLNQQSNVAGVPLPRATVDDASLPAVSMLNQKSIVAEIPPRRAAIEISDLPAISMLNQATVAATEHNTVDAAYGDYPDISLLNANAGHESSGNVPLVSMLQQRFSALKTDQKPDEHHDATEPSSECLPNVSMLQPAVRSPMPFMQPATMTDQKPIENLDETDPNSECLPNVSMLQPSAARSPMPSMQPAIAEISNQPMASYSGPFVSLLQEPSLSSLFPAVSSNLSGFNLPDISCLQVTGENTAVDNAVSKMD